MYVCACVCVPAHAKSLKCHVHFLTEHLGLGWPHFECAVATCGSMLGITAIQGSAYGLYYLVHNKSHFSHTMCARTSNAV